MPVGHGTPSRGSSHMLGAALSEHFEDVADRGHEVGPVFFITELHDVDLAGLDCYLVTQEMITDFFSATSDSEEEVAARAIRLFGVDELVPEPAHDCDHLSSAGEETTLLDASCQNRVDGPAQFRTVLLEFRGLLL
jgi:hypothetical protein